MNCNSSSETSYKGSLTAVAPGWKNCIRPKLPSSSGRAGCWTDAHRAACSEAKQVCGWDCLWLASKRSPKRNNIKTNGSLDHVEHIPKVRIIIQPLGHKSWIISHKSWVMNYYTWNISPNPFLNSPLIGQNHDSWFIPLLWVMNY